MWGNFVDDFRKAPYPKDWDKKGFVPGTGDTLSWADVRADYLEHLDEASRADQARQGEAGAQALPRRLGQVPVLRRVLARLREVAREELQDRIPRGRRAPRRAHAVERRPRRPPAAAHHRRSAVAPGRDRPVDGEGGGRQDSGSSSSSADDGKKKTQEEVARTHEGKIMKNIGSVLATGMLVAAAGLGCGGGNKEAAAPTTGGGRGGARAASRTHVDVAAQKQFGVALDTLNGHDKANDWNDQTCADTAKAFEAAASAQSSGKFPEATYDAGLAYQRCGDDKDAKAHFQQALADDPKFHFARAQLALYQFKADGERRRGDQRARAGRQRRELPERARARRPRDVPDAARLRQRRRELPRQGRRQGRRPAGLRLREAEPPARAGHRRRLHAGVQPARPLLLRQREEEGAAAARSSAARSRRTRPSRSAATFSSSSSRRSSARRPCERARATRRSTTRRASS